VPLEEEEEEDKLLGMRENREESHGRIHECGEQRTEPGRKTIEPQERKTGSRQIARERERERGYPT
jgi:hypothetical protein